MRYEPVKRVVSTQVEGAGRILLRLKDGHYFELNEAGARIWDLLAAGRAPGEIGQALVEEYEVSEATAHTEVGRFLRALQDEGMIQVADEA